MASDPEFGKRLRQAKRKWEEDNDPKTISNEEIGRRVAESVGRKEPYSSQAVGKWLDGRIPEDPDPFAVVRALAALFGCNEQWLGFGPAGGNRPLPATTNRKGKAS